MLDWCRNASHADTTSQIIYPPSTAPAQLSLNRTKQPRFALPASHLLTSRNPKPATRRGIKTHFDRTNHKTEKHVQTCFQRAACTVDSSTQTPKIMVELMKSQRNKSGSLVCSRETSPQHRLQDTQRNIQNTQQLMGNSSYLGRENKRSELMPTQIDMSLRKTNDCKLDTKATNCLVETKDRVERCDRSRFYGAIGVESYHFPAMNRSYIEQRGDVEARGAQEGWRNQEGTEQEELSPVSLRSRGRFQQTGQQMSVSNKYRQMLKNVESQFKLSQKRQSQRNFKQTPNRRILFYQRDTIVSKYNNDDNRQSQQSLMVEQSILMQPSIRSFFTPLGGVEQCGYYTMYVALQNLLGMLVSIKEITVEQHMVRISEQLLVYKQMENMGRVEGVLGLFQTQIDHGCYMLIKQPYTQTLRGYLEAGGGVSEVTVQLQLLLQGIYGMGFMLRGRVEIMDVVLCMGRVKLQNAGLFTLDGSCGRVEIGEAVGYLREQMVREQRDY